MDYAISNFFYPSNICVVGASSKEKSIGYELLNCIKKYKFKGTVFPVNPKSENILGYSCFPSIESISSQIDLAILVVPKRFIEPSVNQLIEKGVKSFIVVTAGFKETGTDGDALEQTIRNKIINAGGRMIGPNCMGVISTIENIKLNATFVAEQPELGKMGFLSQSGALGAAVLNSLRETDIKFAHFISVGNKADINENDITEFWQSDKNIEVLTYYLESFENGKKFIELFSTDKITKPAIVLKAGRTESGMKAASSHTGALGSVDVVIDSVLKQFGIIRANTLNEMFNTAKGFEHFSIAKGKNVAVVTNAGGPAILCVDSIEKNGLHLADLSKNTKLKLKELVLPEASVNNPVDMLPGADSELYKRVNEIVAADKNVDSVISIFVEPVMVEPISVVESICSIESDKPIFQIVMPLPEFWNNFKKSIYSSTPLFKAPEEPAVVISNMLFYNRKKTELRNAQIEIKNRFTITDKYQFNFNNGYLSSNEIDEITTEYNLPIVSEKLFNLDELSSKTNLNYPIVVKGISKDALHKSELNAVKLNIKNLDELLAAAAEIESNFKQNNIQLEKLMIQPFIETKHELLIGGFNDPSFGAIIMFGSGGKYVEVFNDTALRSAYLTRQEAKEMIDETKIGQILKGVRGEMASDIDAIVDLLIKSSKMIFENPQIKEFDFNPVIVDKNNNLHLVDIRINWEN